MDPQLCAYINVAEIIHTTEPDKIELAPHPTTYTTNELDKELVSNPFHSLTQS